MISKNMFCKAMHAILSEKANNKNLETALEHYLVDGYATVRDSATFNVLLELLKEEFKDDGQYSTIEWWLFDKVDKKIYNEDNTVRRDLRTVESLYDYLVENLKAGE